MITQEYLLKKGEELVQTFCQVNSLTCPKVERVDRDNWYFDVCAYYRPETITVALFKCQQPAPEFVCRNWSWPGSVTDRTPYGVLAHELAHHCDWFVSEQKGKYFGDYSINLRKEIREGPITSYCPNDAEWFAEIFRVFITNPRLCYLLRPNFYNKVIERFKPVPNSGLWVKNLLGDPPKRIVDNLKKKVITCY